MKLEVSQSQRKPLLGRYLVDVIVKLQTSKIRFYLYKEGKHPLRGERVVWPRLQQLLAEDCLLYNLAPRVSGLVWCRDRYETENKAINGWYKQQSQIKCKVYQSVPENQKYIDCIEKRKTRLVI